MSSSAQELRDAAAAVRENAYAPYSNFKVGAAMRAAGTATARRAAHTAGPDRGTALASTADVVRGSAATCTDGPAHTSGGTAVVLVVRELIGRRLRLRVEAGAAHGQGREHEDAEEKPRSHWGIQRLARGMPDSRIR